MAFLFVFGERREKLLFLLNRGVMKNIINLMILSGLSFSCFYGCNKNSGLIPSGYYTYPDGPIIENDI